MPPVFFFKLHGDHCCLILLSRPFFPLDLLRTPCHPSVFSLLVMNRRCVMDGGNHPVNGNHTLLILAATTAPGAIRTVRKGIRGLVRARFMVPVVKSRLREKKRDYYNVISPVFSINN